MLRKLIDKFKEFKEMLIMEYQRHEQSYEDKYGDPDDVTPKEVLNKMIKGDNDD